MLRFFPGVINHQERIHYLSGGLRHNNRLTYLISSYWVLVSLMEKAAAPNQVEANGDLSKIFGSGSA